MYLCDLNEMSTIDAERVKELHMEATFEAFGIRTLLYQALMRQNDVDNHLGKYLKKSGNFIEFY